ncbi:hypothetical protein HA402_009564 [Bradysia odoriphaga]|nr:hypothetical protein HA402_009564 [Bradysia odoriphaga]
MKRNFIVLFFIIGIVHSRSLPVNPLDEIIDSLTSDPVSVVRITRQFGSEGSGGSNGAYNNFDYNPFNDTPNNYDDDPYNDSTRRLLYNPRSIHLQFYS